MFNKQMAESPELRELVDALKARRRSRSSKSCAPPVEYLGDEIVIAGFTVRTERSSDPCFSPRRKRDGFPEFLNKESRRFDRGDARQRGGFRTGARGGGGAGRRAGCSGRGIPGHAVLYAHRRIVPPGRGPAAVRGDLSAHQCRPAPARSAISSRNRRKSTARWNCAPPIGFEGQRTGMAAWLADPAPMGSLDYVSPEATFVTAFVVKNPVVIVDELLVTYRRSATAAQEALATAQQQTGIDVRNDLAASLGGEFSLSLDGPPFPVPSWKLVTEVYDPSARPGHAAEDHGCYNREAVKQGEKPLRTAQETVEGRTYYMIAGGRSESAHRGALHLRRRLPDRRARRARWCARAAGEDRRHVDHALGAVPGAWSRATITPTSRRWSIRTWATRSRPWPDCSAHSSRRTHRRPREPADRPQRHEADAAGGLRRAGPHHRRGQRQLSRRRHGESA